MALCDAADVENNNNNDNVDLEIDAAVRVFF